MLQLQMNRINAFIGPSMVLGAGGVRGGGILQILSLWVKSSPVKDAQIYLHTKAQVWPSSKKVGSRRRNRTEPPGSQTGQQG